MLFTATILICIADLSIELIYQTLLQAEKNLNILLTQG